MKRKNGKRSWAGLGWAGQSCSTDGQTEELSSKTGQGVRLPRQLPLVTLKREKKHPDCATAWSDLIHLCKQKSSYE